MASIWIFVILGAIGLFLFVKVNPGFRYGRFWSTLVGALIIFFVVSLGYVLTISNTDVTSFEGVTSGMKAYVVWLGNFFDNTATITGNVINTDWKGNVTK